MNNIDLYAEHAKEKKHLPENWQAFRWECFPKGGGELIYVAVTGAVCEAKFLRGKRKGNTDYTKRDRATEATVNLPLAEHKAWRLDWERRTGKCWKCTGAGKVFERWSVKEGVTHCPCPRCKGTGLSIKN